MKYILVTGGVISGIGKGIIASSIGTILKSCGLRVTSIKIDPYINIDAGTFSPYEHGEWPCGPGWHIQPPLSQHQGVRGCCAGEDLSPLCGQRVLLGAVCGTRGLSLPARC